jgi:PAS domain-containing protein
LLEVLLGILRLDFAYAPLSDAIDGSPIEVVRSAGRRNPAVRPQAVGQALHDWLAGGPPTLPVVVANPIGEAKVSIAPLPLGLQDDVGVLGAGSQQTDFPTKIERLLLRVAANQAAVGLQEARRLSEQKRAAEELERRVVERTAQLTVANEDLRREIIERQRAEEERGKLASLVENSTDFIAIASLESQVLFVNSAGQELVGLDGDEHVRATRIPDYARP